MSRTILFPIKQKEKEEQESGYSSSSSSLSKTSIVDNQIIIENLPQSVISRHDNDLKNYISTEKMQKEQISPPSLRRSKRLSCCVEKDYTEALETDNESKKKRRRSRSKTRYTNIENGSTNYKSIEKSFFPSPCRMKVSKPRRKSEYVENNVLPNKKKIIRRKSVYFETTRILTQNETFEVEESRSPSLSSNSESNESCPEKLRENVAYIESFQEAFSSYLNANPKQNETKSQTVSNSKTENFIEDIGFIKIEMINGKSVMKFHVKWVGSPPESNTYELLESIRHCDVLLEFIDRKFKFYQSEIEEICTELQSQLADIQEIANKSYIIKKLKKFDEIEFKSSLLAIIYDYDKKASDSFIKNIQDNHLLYQYYLKWKEEEEENCKTIESIMKAENSSFTLTSENDIDFEPIPKFIYLPKVKYPKIKLMKVGCKCKECSSDSPLCCPISKGYDFVYSEMNERLCTKDIQMIVECNDFCSCKSNCPNRPKKISVNLQIFKTENRGWGIKASEDIPSGTFITEYTGEFLNRTEATRRASEYHKTGNTYMFDLDYNDECKAYYSIDATYQGNLSRFINHSCNPNLQTWPATSCNNDPLMHKLYYFSQRFIRAGEELTIDYTGGRQPNGLNVKNKECFCHSSNCKKFIF